MGEQATPLTASGAIDFEELVKQRREAGESGEELIAGLIETTGWHERAVRLWVAVLDGEEPI